VLIKEIILREDPWPHMSNVEVAIAVASGTIDLHIPPNIPVITPLLKDCFAFDPNHRPDFYAICNRLESLSTNSAGLNITF
jgi:hypothetical protein